MCDFEAYDEFLDQRDRDFAKATTPAAKARFIDKYGQDAWDWLQQWKDGKGITSGTPR